MKTAIIELSFRAADPSAPQSPRKPSRLSGETVPTYSASGARLCPARRDQPQHARKSPAVPTQPINRGLAARQNGVIFPGHESNRSEPAIGAALGRRFQSGRFDSLREIFMRDAVVQGVLGPGGRDQVIAIWLELHADFGVQLNVMEMIAEGDCVAVRYVERGIFRGDFRGHTPTGKTYELVAMEWFTIKDGKIQARWGARDFASQARPIGLPLA